MGDQLYSSIWLALAYSAVLLLRVRRCGVQRYRLACKSRQDFYALNAINLRLTVAGNS